VHELQGRCLNSVVKCVQTIKRMTVRVFDVAIFFHHDDTNSIIDDATTINHRVPTIKDTSTISNDNN
jgi:hypothetical protein